MKINLSEYKKYGDLESLFNNMLLYCLDNWDDTFRNTLEWETMIQYKFIKKDYLDLKEIELVDELLLEVSLKILLNNLIMKDSYNNININLLVNASEKEISSFEDMDTNIENTIYFKSLKKYNLINSKNEIDIEIINQNNNLKKYFINTSLNIVKDMGVEWNPIITKCLIKFDIIKE